ncbi:TonB-linked SusC/RagA family outer membrane protein [Neolewinella xylanilytica]|uniref:TonB-linked SusC/RagA family outer membrane protein n=1 Tax=Neolewinella xylanilytica TaxID=1514080 RepID=A0A2S6I6G5_9BACT|nr:TonB-dependent receptor [Neolewinella xylanilytica]PPK87096.1 TonB-linked SusC/RagA family outer membrane protein [Neolewinella xylanilytica]
MKHQKSATVSRRCGLALLFTAGILANLQAGASAPPAERSFLQSAATVIVTGTVQDETGEPLPGATILEEGTQNGTVTDIDGAYTLEVAENATLIISFIGYESMNVEVEGRTEIDVNLRPASGTLEEVVVIGYGEQKRSDLAGAVSEISNKEISENPTPNISNTLVGRTPGIIATQRSGAPGDDASQIFIRGIGTTGDASPLYVIDGIVRSARDFSQLNSNEIESVSILKDAASAAVFGVRGGNGVVLVTTRRGREGRMQVSLSANYGLQERTNEQQFLGSYEYAKLYNEALTNQGDDPLYSEDDLDKYREGSSPDTHPDADWLSVLDDWAPIQNYSLGANGGTERIRYSALLGYVDQKGIVPSNEFNRYNYRSNIDADVTTSTRLSFDLSGRDEVTNDVAATDVFRWMAGTPPNEAPIQWSNGTYSSGPAYLTLPENGYRNRRIQNFNGRLQLVQQLPLEGLSLMGIASYNKDITGQKNFTYPQIPFYNRLGDGTFVEQPRGQTSLYQSTDDYQSLTLQAHLNFTRELRNSSVSALLLYTQTKDQWRFTSAYRDGFTLAIDEIDFGGVDNRTNSGYSGTRARQGVVGRLNYTIAEKIILEGSFRADGSEQFAPGNRWGFFPSGSLGYIISKENFMQGADFLDFLKLRTSYGVLGNDRIGGSRFLYLQSYRQISGAAVFGDGNVVPGIVEGNLANPNVTWETVKKFNVGFDAKFLDYKWSFSADYFMDKRSDILGSRNLSVPSLLGVGLPVENLSKVDNEGVELSLGHMNTVSDNFSYSINANFTYARNTVVFIDEPESENPNIRRTGRPLGAQFGFNALGIFQTEQQIENAAEHLTDVEPGDIQYEDVNNDGVIDDLDRVYIGSSNTPEIIYGLGGNIKLHNFELSLLFQGATNVNQYYSGEGVWPFFVGAGAFETNLDRWTPTNTDASEPRVLIDATNNHAGSSFWLEDASYLRLKNVEVAYNLPTDRLFGGFVKNVRVFFNANNVYTWTGIENFDPENADGRGWGYPQLRIWNTGLTANF